MATNPDDNSNRGHERYDVSGAIELLEPGKPLLLFDGLFTTDNGHLIMSQYVDIAPDKTSMRPFRPTTLVKAIEQRYALEFSPTIQISAPHRFRDAGESGIQDDQEGRAMVESPASQSTRTYTDQNLEQQEALQRLLDNPDISVGETVIRDRDTDSSSLTFGRSMWIYCTSFHPAPDLRDPWRASLPKSYNHESVIRQPIRFAYALASAFADQHGPQGQPADCNHEMPGVAIQSLHAAQTIMHGPVWYTDDVYGYLGARVVDDPLYYFYPLFVKDNEYRDQLEYRFVLHCNAPVDGETLLLETKSDLLASLAPHGARSPVTFRPFRGDDPGETPVETRATHSANTVTSTRTRRDRVESRWSLTDRQPGNVLQEGTQVTEQEVVVTSRATGTAPHPDADLEAIPAGRMRVTRSTHRTRAVDGTQYDTSTEIRTRVFTIGEQPEVQELFDLEAADHPAELLAAVAKPFATVAQWPPTVAGLLEGLAAKTVSLGPEAETAVMSACWNAIWAVANLCSEFGDIIESVDIEDSRFVAIALRESNAGVRGKILVGPRGTFAYLLSPVGVWRHGGTTDRLILFPDDLTRSHFEQAGWSPLTAAATDRADD